MSYTPKRQNNAEQKAETQSHLAPSTIYDNRASTVQAMQLQQKMRNSQQPNAQLMQRMANHQPTQGLQMPLQRQGHRETPQAQFGQDAPVQLKTPWAYIPNKIPWSRGQLVQKDNYHISMMELGNARGNFSKFHITDELSDGDKNPHFFFKDTGVMEHGKSNQHPQSVAFKDDEELNVDPHTWDQLLEEAPVKAKNFLDEVKATNGWGGSVAFTMTGRFPKAHDAETVKGKLPEFEEDTASVVAAKGARSGNKHFIWTITVTFADRDKAFSSWQALSVTAPWTGAKQA